MTWAPDSLDVLARFLLAEAEIEGPPVDVERLARSVGVARIRPARLDGEVGRLELQGSDFVISVDSDASLARRRFTIAHEVAHLALADPRFDLRALRRQPGLRSEERFCDRLAESLLMPLDWVAEGYRDRPQELRTLLGFVNEFGASAAAATVRLQRTASWSRSLLRFQVLHGVWTLLSVTAWRGEARSAVHANAATKAVVSRFALPETESRLWLPLRAGGSDWVFGAELYGRDGWAFALVDPGRRRLYSRSGDQAIVGELGHPGLKLFYSLDDIDACIIAPLSELEGSDERSNGESRSLEAIAA